MVYRVRYILGSIALGMLLVVLNVSVCQSGADSDSTTQTNTQADPDSFAIPMEKVSLKSGDTLVFLGDSITHQCLYTQYVEDFFYTRFPKTRIRFHNSGVGGAKAWDALQRFDQDVAGYQPKYVTVLLGMNDGRYQPFQQEIFDTYRTDMLEVIARIKKTGATPILMTPTMFDARAARMKSKKETASEKLEFYNSVLAYYGQWLREQATRNGYGFVDMYSPLNNLTLEERKTDPRFTMIPDSVHPGPAGQLVMAYALIEGFGLRKPLSNIRIVPDGQGALKSQVSGGTVSDLKQTTEGVEFTYTANALPWVLPEETKVGAKLLHLGHKASREALEFHNLPAGQYELTIDEQSVGSYSATQLARHIELQDNPHTPQYQQALKVAMLNQERNTGPVRSLRNEWRTFQIHARLAKSLTDDPKNTALEKQVAKYAKQLENQDQRVQEFEAAAKKIEDQIFQINQPKPRKYVLKPIAAVKVSGTVLLDGKPISNVQVVFHGKGPAVISSSLTDEKGKFQIPVKDRSRFVPGFYRVVVQSPPARPKDKSNEEPGKEFLPRKYQSLNTTGLSFEARKGEVNTLKIELESR